MQQFGRFQFPVNDKWIDRTYNLTNFTLARSSLGGKPNPNPQQVAFDPKPWHIIYGLIGKSVGNVGGWLTQMSRAAIDFSNIAVSDLVHWGSGDFPYWLEHPMVVGPNEAFKLDLTNLVDIVNPLELTFLTIAVYDSKDAVYDVLAKFADGTNAPAPLQWYMWAIRQTLAGGEQPQVDLDLNGQEDFVRLAINGSGTHDFAIDLSVPGDSNGSDTDNFTFGTNFVGTAQHSRLKQQRLLPKNSKLRHKLKNLDAVNANTIEICHVGVNYPKIIKP